MSEEELEKEYYADRPIEPYSDDDSPNDWANIAHYAEENLEKAFKRIAELELKLEALEGQIPWKDIKDKSELIKENVELKADNAELKEKLKPENCLKLLAKEGYIKFTSEHLTKAKEIIKSLLRLWNDVMTEETVKALVTDAEQFLNEVEK